MKKDVAEFIRTCHTCQPHKAKFCPRGNKMAILIYSYKPLEIVHLDFSELRKKSEGVKGTQAFLVTIDESTRMVAANTGREDANSVIALLQHDLFKSTMVIVADNGPTFRSRKLWKWAEMRGITIHFPTSYHPEANGLAERVIHDIK